MAEPKAPDASVVISTRDRPRDLERCLVALAAQRTDRSFEVVVVDDASQPPLGPATIAVLPQARLIRGEGRGPARARNLGVAQASGSIVCFTDDDTAPDPGWVEAAATFLEEHPEHVAVEGPIVSPPYDRLYEISLENESPGGFMTANIAYRRGVLEQLGGFDVSFPRPHCEDLDLAFRAEAVGPIGFTGAMRVTHFPRPITAVQFVRRARMSASEVDLFARHRSRFGRAARLPPRVFPVVSVLLYWTRYGRREGWSLLRPPWRLVRFAGMALAHIGMTIVTVARRPPVRPVA